MNETARPIVFGEVLFDCFGDDCRLGGAPFNVAWHLQGFGLSPCFVSRVGKDALGEEVRARMQGWGMDTRWLQVDESRPTGRVHVRLRQGQPSYEILDDQAYDAIEAPQGLDTHGRVLYHGTLALRHAHNRAVLARLREGAQVFLDLNLRAPWWRPEAVAQWLTGCRWLKLNDEEFAALAPGLSPASFARRHRLQALILTRGAHGAEVWLENEQVFAPAPVVDEVIDAVGAGDAFSAVALYGILHDWPWPTLLQRAAAFAARLCRQRGALIEDPNVYRETLHAWKAEADLS